MKPEDRDAIDQSLREALRICRRLGRCSDSRGLSAAMKFATELRKLGATEEPR